MSRKSDNRPTGIPLRKILAATIGGAFLIVLLVYLAAISESTGYEEYARVHRRPSRLSPEDGGMAAPDNVGESSAEPEATGVTASAGGPCIKAVTSSNDLRSLDGSLLMDESIPYYRDHAIYRAVTGFDPADPRASLESQASGAVAEIIEKTPRTRLAGKADEADMPQKVALAALLLDAVEADILDSTSPIDPSPLDPRELSLTTQVGNLLPPAILRTEYRGDREKATRQTRRALDHLLYPIRHRLDGYTYNAGARLEITTLIATEHGLVEPSTLANAQAALMDCRFHEDELDAIRADLILRTADMVRANPDQWILQKINVWPHFMGGQPRNLVAAVMKPVFRKRVEEYAMAMADRDEERRRKSLLSLDQTATLMNYNQAWSVFDNGEFEQIDNQRTMGSVAPWLYDPESFVNREVDSAILVVASCRHRLEKGAWPARPEDLVPEYLDPALLEESIYTWHCALVPVAGQEQGSFAIVQARYSNNFRGDDGKETWLGVWNVDDPGMRERIKAGPMTLWVETRVNLYSLYESDFRRLLAPETVEEP